MFVHFGFVNTASRFEPENVNIFWWQDPNKSVHAHTVRLYRFGRFAALNGLLLQGLQLLVVLCICRFHAVKALKDFVVSLIRGV